ncbi:YhjD/YihY/BrkB family envelope integrity protein [Archangium sp.]|uniref:YhjD/YihY/BrkB family envelope integrity protein n=1 Tax=Archangium sp. TaxID=1872627 RepID=UPI002D437CC8|nr:YhjD/YihY/BrkB family envelope integrity protein [Archangium sp.]HYO57302.1 YhjD/YihY/BrkB family envelope integrity protein [Archangium sp.]
MRIPLLLQRLRASALQWARRTWAPLERTRTGRFATDTLQAVRSLARGFEGENIRLRAAALTYISVFSLVPLLTVVLALLGAYHQQAFQQRLRELIFAVMAPGVREESAAFLDRFLEPGHTTAIGSAGFLGLLFSAGSLLHNIDVSLNEIWGVKNHRPWLIRGLIYAGLLLLGPLMLAISFAGTGVVRSFLEDTHTPLVLDLFELLFGALSPLMAAGGLTLLYYVTPNTHLRLRSALAGGLVAGAAWSVARHVYTGAAAYSFRHNPLYASLGALPMFLAWLYVDWLLFLIGARLSYAVEHATFRDSLWAFGAHPRARELVAARVAQETTLVWYDNGTPPLPRDLALRLRVAESLVHEVVDDLERAGLLERHRRGGILPARAPAELTLADLTLAVHGVYHPAERGAQSTPRAPGFEVLDAFFRESDRAGLDVLRQTRWLDLAILVRPGLAEARTAAAPTAAESGNP